MITIVKAAVLTKGMLMCTVTSRLEVPRDFLLVGRERCHGMHGADVIGRPSDVRVVRHRDVIDRHACLH